MGKIMGICISEKKGTAKHAVEQAILIEDFGLAHDAHAGKWHRQVSLLSYETREGFNAKGASVIDGAFGENILVSGIDLTTLPVGTLLKTGSITLEVTQIGKECHSHCAIYQSMGECIMPTNGIFAKVITGGLLKKGDEIAVVRAEE